MDTALAMSQASSKMKAPQGLLSGSVFALLIALGIYLGFTWTRNLDANAGFHDSRNVFIIYVVSLAVCLIVYSISALLGDRDGSAESDIAEQFCEEWLKHHPDKVELWRLEADDGGVSQQQNMPKDKV